MKTIKNNLRMIGYIYKVAPMYLISMFLCSIIQALLAVGGLWADKVVISRLMDGRGIVTGLFLFYGFYIVLDYVFEQVRNLMMNRFNSLHNVDFSIYMRRLLYDKVKDFDISCYEDQEFYNNYERVVGEIDTRPIQVTNIGLNALTSFLSDKGFAKLKSDIRISHLLYEHSICNRDRFEYLLYKKIIDEDFYQRIYDVAKAGCDTSLILRNLILKMRFGGKVDDTIIKKFITQLIDIETQIADLVICKFERDISLP